MRHTRLHHTGHWLGILHKYNSLSGVADIDCVDCIRYRPLAEEVSGDVSSSSIGSTLAAKLGGEEAANAALYILLR